MECDKLVRVNDMSDEKAAEQAAYAFCEGKVTIVEVEETIVIATQTDGETQNKKSAEEKNQDYKIKMDELLKYHLFRYFCRLVLILVVGLDCSILILWTVLRWGS